MEIDNEFMILGERDEGEFVITHIASNTYLVASSVHISEEEDGHSYLSFNVEQFDDQEPLPEEYFDDLQKYMLNLIEQSIERMKNEKSVQE